MALKVLMLRKKLNDANKALEALRARDAEFDTRETELANDIEAAESAEERAAVEEAIDSFETEKAAHKTECEGLERTIADLEKDLEDEEKRQDTTPAQIPEERKENKPMITREFFGMTPEARTAFFEREDVKNYLGEVRACISEKRALTNVGLTIPEVFLGLLRENIAEYSKLYKHCNVKQISGDGRLVVMGTVPEAIWTECCGAINELDLVFNDLEVGCYKLGGYFAVCNAALEDNDIGLASELMTVLGQAIGKALDKAILYGTGTRMPQGVVTRLAQTSEPADYPATARTWVDLHSTNIKTTANTGASLFTTILTNFGAAKGKYSRGEIVHVMNETTYTYLMAQAATFDAQGAVVSKINGTMPLIGGVIEVIEDVADYNIISGYFDLYLLAERAGNKFATSEHVRFIQDQTVFKGTARYDGKPAIAEGFVVNGVNNQSVVTTKSFAIDAANTPSIALNASAASMLTNGTLQLVAYTFPNSQAVTWASSTTAKATVSSAGLVTAGATSGSTTITATAGGLTASCVVTITTE